MIYLALLSVFALLTLSFFVFLPRGDTELDWDTTWMSSQDDRQMPALGIGTWLSERSKVAEAVSYALDAGYRHVDAASIYRNEAETDRGIDASRTHRRDIWVTSKLWNSDHRPEQASLAIRKSLSDLRVDSLDLYLMHWPVAFVPGSGTELDHSISIIDTWRAMEGFVRANLTRHIGMSNFAKRDVDTIMSICGICPFAHEFETHPYLQQQDFVDYHKNLKIKVIAYSPLANTNPVYQRAIQPILQDPFWETMAERKNATVPQAVLGWGLQRGTVVIPKSVHHTYIEENMGSLDIVFTRSEMREIAESDKKARMNNPGRSWGVELFADLDDPTRLMSNGEEADL